LVPIVLVIEDQVAEIVVSDLLSGAPITCPDNPNDQYGKRANQMSSR
jgi:hypothetical protein